MIYTEQQEKMMQEGKTLCVECQKGYWGDQSCGANGGIQLPLNTPSGCTSGKKIEKIDFECLSLDIEQAEKFSDNAIKDDVQTYEMKVIVGAYINIDMKKFNEKYGKHSKMDNDKLSEYIKSELLDIHKSILCFGKNLEMLGCMIDTVQIATKKFSIKEKLEKLIYESLKNLH